MGVSIKELLSYKDLLFRLVRKEFLSSYQQTLLGPFWVLLKPLLTVLTYMLVFTKVMRVSTEGVPPFVYFLIGITLWNLFSDIFLFTAKTFMQNQSIFSKIYFPLIFGFTGQVHLNFNNILISIPVIVITAGIGFGAGLVFAILTAKYKDLFALLQLIISLLMFVCPIFYSLSMVPQKVKWIVNINPLSSQFEMFRYAFLGKGEISGLQFLYSTVFMGLLVTFGVLLFNKMSDQLMDIA